MGIRILAICVFRNGNRILVRHGIDGADRSQFFRPLGGGVELGERTAEALTREIREETRHEIHSLELLGVLENLFTFEGRHGHEIVFVFDARFADPAAYEASVPGTDDDGEHFEAEWLALSSFTGDRKLVPDGLLEMLCSDR
jgi:8-oxo-dGTP pyrophosphatase MutT (NUDIX family)